jgi:hypothetical protein
MSNKRSTPRKVAAEYLRECEAIGYRPTLDEIVTEAMVNTNYLTIEGVVAAHHRDATAQVSSLLRASDPETHLRLWLPIPVEGVSRWHPHARMHLDELTASARLVTRPQTQAQVRAERRRSIEREVMAELERQRGVSLTTEEAWPEVQLRLAAEGLL